MSLEGHQVAQQGLDSYMQDIRLMPVVAPACRSGDQECPHIAYTSCIDCLGFVTRYWVQSMNISNCCQYGARLVNWQLT